MSLTSCPGSGFLSSKEASWVEMVPLLISWEVSPRGDPHPEEEAVVAVEPHLGVEAAVAAEVAMDHSKAVCCSGLPEEEEEEEADS